MGTIGIHPKLKLETWLYGTIKRQTGLTVVSGRFDHLVAPGQSVKAPPKKRAGYTPPPFNGGGRAA